MYVAHYDDQSVFFFIRKQLIMLSVSPFFKDLQLSLAQWWIFLKKNTKNNVRKVLFFVTYLLDWKMKVGLSSPLTFILEKYWCANVYSIWLPSKPQYGDYCTVCLRKCHWLAGKCSMQYKIATLSSFHFEGALPAYLSAIKSPSLFSFYLYFSLILKRKTAECP